jgi:hypothetical protein
LLISNGNPNLQSDKYMPNDIINAALEPAVKGYWQQQLRKKTTILWTVLGIVGLLYAWGRNSFGWQHDLALPFYLGLWVVSTLYIWIRHQLSKESVRSVARKIEQEHPKLQAALITALDQEPDPASGDYHILQTRVIREALENNLKEPWDHPIHIQVFMTGIVRFASLLVVGFAAFLLTKQAPEKASQGAAITAFKGELKVEPGNQEMERGGAVVITARFGNKVPTQVNLVIMPSNGQTKKMTMNKSMDDPLFGASLLSVDADTAYYVEFDGKESETYKLSVFEYPALQQADAHLNYPDYTGEEDRTIKDTLRVSAIEGTKLNYEFHLNKPVTSATLTDRDGELISLIADTTRSNVYTLSSVLVNSTRYELNLQDADGRSNKTPSLIVLRVLTNQPPNLKFKFPAGDQRFSALEEVALEGETWDDFGLKAHGIGYQVSGQEQVDLQLGDEAPAKKKINLAHLLLLEDLSMEPGDLISYYLWAEDIGPDGSVRRAYSDMFFGEIRPFEEIFRQGQPNGQQQQQQQQGQQQGNPAMQLAELQKEIISASWNIRKTQSGSAVSEKGKEDLEVVLTSQEEAVTQAETVMQRMNDPKSVELLTEAKEAMEAAADSLYDAVHDRSIPALTTALVHEQKAYQLILKAQPDESDVTEGGGGGGGGGGRSQQQLNQLELTEEQSRYETQSQAQGMQDEQQNEALQNLNRLKELARRQEDLNERLQELQTALNAADSEEEREEIERELKRLRDEQRRMLEDMDELNQRLAENQTPESAESMQQLDQIREQAQRAAESIEQQEISDALAAGSRAQEGLEEMRDEFRQRNSSQFSDAMKELRQRAREMSERQDELQQQLSQAQGTSQRQSLGSSSQAQEAMDMSEEQKKELSRIMEEIRRLSDESEDAEPLLSQQLSETYRMTDQEQLEEMLEMTQQLSRLNMLDRAAELEQRIHPEIESLEERIDRAAQSILGDGIEGLRRARNLLEELSEDLNQEIAQATGNQSGRQPGEGQGSETTPGEGQGSSAEPQENQDPTALAQGQGNQPGQGSGDSQTPGQGQGQGQNAGENEQLAQNESGQGQGSGAGQGQGQGGGEGGEPTPQRQGLREGNGQGQSSLAQSWMNQNGGNGNGSGGGSTTSNPQAPLTGDGFREWSDQLREVEEMVDVPELQNEIASIRDRAQAVRREMRNEGKEPKWDLVQMEIEKPLYEVRKRINNELSKRLSKEAVVPIDRDPVPQQFSDLVRSYYETLGEGR